MVKAIEIIFFRLSDEFVMNFWSVMPIMVQKSLDYSKINQKCAHKCSLYSPKVVIVFTNIEA